MQPDWIEPDWPAPRAVRALITSRNGGVSQGPYGGAHGGGLNLGAHVGDDVRAVAANRAQLLQHLPAAPRWLAQVHGRQVADLDVDVDVAADLDVGTDADPIGEAEAAPRVAADAATARRARRVCAVLVADCMPVLLCDRRGQVVAVAHAGWRGLAGGILESTVRAMAVAPGQLIAYLGPAIGQDAFEVGADVFQAFVAADGAARDAFRAGRPGKWHADLEALARQRLARLGVAQVYGGGRCTVTDRDTFFSYRRDGVTGRMAALIWLDQASASDS